MVAVTQAVARVKGRYLGTPGLPLAGKISLFLLLVVSLAALGMAWLGQDIVLRKFGETEAELVLRNRHVLLQAIQADVDSVDTITLDWSQWNQLYGFARDGDPEFVAEEINPEALERLQLDVIQFLDLQGRLIRQEVRTDLPDQGSGTGADIGTAIRLALTGKTGRGTAPVAGWLNTGIGPMVLASRPILKSDGTGPVAGSLIMARRLNPAVLSAELSVLPSEVIVHSRGTGSLTPELRELVVQLEKDPDGASLFLREADMSLFRYFRDINGGLAFVLETRMPRSILVTGRETTHQLAIVLLGSGVVIFLLLLLVIRFSVSRPLGKLASHMALLRETGEIRPAPGTEYGDEIGTLARSFNELLESRQKVEAELRALSAVAEYADESIAIMASDGTVAWVNPVFERSRRMACADVAGRHPYDLFKGRDDPAMYRSIWALVETGKTWKGRMHTEVGEGEVLIEDVVVSPVLEDGQSAPSAYVMLFHDVTERIAMEAQLAQAHKLEAVGQLAAGVAHEINTPAQYVHGNIRFLEEAFTALVDVLGKIDVQARAAGEGGLSAADLSGLLEQAELDYLQAEVPQALQQMIDGVARIAGIVQSMKELTDPAPDFVPANLNTIIEGAVYLAGNEWSDTADIGMELAADLPSVMCQAESINQVLVNMLDNAGRAIEEAGRMPGSARGHIVVATRRVATGVEISVRDDGAGMSEEVRKRAFDPFFTTRAPGKGTGQGLAIAYSVIAKHGGTVSVTSEAGCGSCFTIHLPLTAGQPSADQPVSGGHENPQLLGDANRLAG
jgi:PAS domain S-box-containing protein